MWRSEPGNLKFRSFDRVYILGICAMLALAGGMTCRPATGPRQASPDGFPDAVESPKVVGVAVPGVPWVPRGGPAQPLMVLFKAPVKRATGTVEIVVTFNQPMVRLGRAVSRAEDPSRYPIVVDPPVKAVYRWVAGDTLKVALTKPLKNAHRYRVTVPASAQSVAGSTLGKALTWHFETPRPRLAGVSVVKATKIFHDRVHPADRYLLTFNLRVTLAEVRRTVKVLVNGNSLGFTVAREKKKNAYRAVLKLASRPPLAARIVVKAPKGLGSTEGPLRSDEVFQQKYQVFGSLRSTSVQCDRADAQPKLKCWPMVTDDHAGLRLSFSEHVTRAELLKHLRITPRPAKLQERLQTAHDSCWIKGKPKVRCARGWSIADHLLPRRKYRVSITPGLRDVNGQRLVKGRKAQFATRDFPPGIFPPDGNSGFRERWHPYRFKAINVKRMDADLYTFRGADLVRFLRCRRGLSWVKACLSKRSPTRRVVKLRGAPNKLHTASIQLPYGLNVVRFGSPQVVDHKGKRVVFYRMVSRTDLGVQARLTAYGLTIWVTSLQKARPSSGTKVTVYSPWGKQLWEGKTGARGVVELPLTALGSKRGSRPPSLVVLASTSDDQSHLVLDTSAHRGRCRWTRYGYYWRSREDTGHSADEIGRCDTLRGDQPLLAGYISTERGIYRPGHLVHLHGAVRRYVAWRGVPATGLNAEVRLVNPSSVVVGKKRVKLGEHGVFLARIALPSLGRLGYHRAELWAQGNRIASHSFRMAEYRAPRFVTRVRAKPDPVFTGGALDIAVTGRYLFGGAMAGAALELSIHRNVYSQEVPNHPEYRVGARGELVGFPAKTWHRSSGTLNSTGQYQRRVDLKAAGGAPFPWTCNHHVEAVVRSAAHRTAAGSDWVRQHPGDRYAAIKALDSAGTATRRHVLVVTPKGNTREGSTVTVRVYATKRGRYNWTSVVDWSRILWKRVLPVGRAGAMLTVPWPQKYARSDALLWLSVLDAKGREARTAQLFSKPTRWSEANEKRERLDKQRARELTVRTDKSVEKDERYLPGQTAIVTVTRRGIRGDVVLFVERERIFRTIPLTFDAKGQAVVRLRVLKKYVSSVTLRVVMVRAGKALRGKKGPLFSAFTKLLVSHKPYRLYVDVKADQKVYRPGGKVQVKLRVRDGLNRARPSRVVLMAVDESVLNLTGYRLPNPYNQLAYTPPDDILADDVRRHLATLGITVLHVHHAALPSVSGMGGLGLSGRGGGGGASSAIGALKGRAVGRKQKPRRKFLTTAWHATVVTDPKGRATTSFTLPDNVTAYRIMAFAVDKERSAGTGRTRFEVDLPLLSLPALPRFLRAGDDAYAGVVIYNQQTTGTAVVTARVTGPVKLTGPATQRVKLIKGRGANVRFALRATKKGTAKFTFTVRVGKNVDTVESELEVQRPTLMEASSVSGQTQGAVRHAIERMSGLRRDVGGLEVSLASTALTGVEDGMEQLIGYPYGCLEQKSSRLLAMIAATALGDRFNLKLPGSPRAWIHTGLHQVLAMQRSDGGFGYWPSSTYSWPWATAYALVILHRAQLAKGATGVTVPAQAVRNAVRFLRRHLRYNRRSMLRRYKFSYFAFIVYALRLHGEDVTKPALKLVKNRVRKPLFARSLLLATLAASPTGKHSAKVQKRVKKAIDDLADELGNSLRIDGTTAHAEENLGWGYQVMMHSNDRTTAMVLLALLNARPKHVMVLRLVRWFLQGRRQARFRNTQEAAWAVMAMWDYARILEKQVPDFEAGIWLGKKRILKAIFRGRSVKPQLRKLHMADIMRIAGTAARSLLIAKRGKGTLYYLARLRYARRQLPTKPRDRGFRVRKTILVLSNAGVPLKKQRPPRLGDTVLVTLKVKTTIARRYVVVDDPLPAGLEAIDSSLATASRSVGAFLGRMRSDWYSHRELRDNRVLFFRDLVQPSTLTFRYLARVSTPGRFLSPPTKAEEMYNPETFGHNATRTMHFARR